MRGYLRQYDQRYIGQRLTGFRGICRAWSCELKLLAITYGLNYLCQVIPNKDLLKKPPHCEGFGRALKESFRSFK